MNEKFRKCKVVPLCWNCCNAHEPIECRTLNKFNLPVTFLIDNFDVVTPLRVLLQFYLYGEQRNNGIDNDADENKDRIDEMLNMESHCEKRRNSSIWQEYARNVIEPLRNVAKIDDIFQPLQLPWQLTDDFLQRIFGILDVNSFEVRTPNFEVTFFHVYFSHSGILFSFASLIFRILLFSNVKTFSKSIFLSDCSDLLTFVCVKR